MQGSEPQPEDFLRLHRTVLEWVAREADPDKILADLCGLVEDLITDLTDKCNPETVLIVSDHGFQGARHTDYGCLALGGSLRSAIRLPDDCCARVYDIAPTVASYFGIPFTCDGVDLLDRDASPGDAEIDEKDERDEILERLRDLGYHA